ncbi:MAG TPA: VanW family protein [Gaiellaceae bacterium]|nr:VanW family protein [Gaiellaceae bacterium]
MHTESPLYLSPARRRRRSLSALTILAVGTGVVALLGVLLGLAFAGSSRELAEGTRVAGVDIGGLTQRQAVATLDARFSRVADKPVAFVAGDQRFAFAANQLGVHPDWKTAVAAAARSGAGFGPIRGFRRLHTRFFGAEVHPRLAVSNAALEFALDRIAGRVDHAPESAALVRRGLRIEVVPEQAGRRLDREGAAEVVARTLGSLERTAGRTTLPVTTATAPVTAAVLAPVARRARIALSGPVVLRSAGKSWRLPRWRVAELLALPSGGASRLAISGPLAEDYFTSLSRRVAKPPVDARFAVSGERVEIVPSRAGVELDVPRTARALMRAMLSPTNRTATLVIARAVPERRTADALAMGIDRRMGVYKTYNAGTADRITNLRLGVTLLDDTLVAPGGTFSLNGAIGERTTERGFRPAPVIIGTRYEEEVGGGSSQVATTVFNAAWEAGLKVTERHPHSLYISRYQLGRDATVYWPSLDLKFVNDTKRWVLVKGWVEADGIAVAIYGGEGRRVESSPGARSITGSPPVQRVKDPTLPKGRTVVEAEGSAPSRTTVIRTIYGEDGKELRTETWTTSYKGETRIVRVGTKPKQPVKGADEKAKPGAKETAPTGEAAIPPATRP